MLVTLHPRFVHGKLQLPPSASCVIARAERCFADSALPSSFSSCTCTTHRGHVLRLNNASGSRLKIVTFCWYQQRSKRLDVAKLERAPSPASLRPSAFRRRAYSVSSAPVFSTMLGTGAENLGALLGRPAVVDRVERLRPAGGTATVTLPDLNLEQAENSDKLAT